MSPRLAAAPISAEPTFQDVLASLRALESDDDAMREIIKLHAQKHGVPWIALRDAVAMRDRFLGLSSASYPDRLAAFLAENPDERQRFASHRDRLLRWCHSFILGLLISEIAGLASIMAALNASVPIRFDEATSFGLLVSALCMVLTLMMAFSDVRNGVDMLTRRRVKDWLRAGLEQPDEPLRGAVEGWSDAKLRAAKRRLVFQPGDADERIRFTAADLNRIVQRIADEMENPESGKDNGIYRSTYAFGCTRSVALAALDAAYNHAAGIRVIAGFNWPASNPDLAEILKGIREFVSQFYVDVPASMVPSDRSLNATWGFHLREGHTPEEALRLAEAHHARLREARTGS